MIEIGAANGQLDLRPVQQARAPMRRWILALGGNLGDPQATLPVAWQKIVAALRLQQARLSQLVQSEPAEGASGPLFCNAVGCGHSDADPAAGLILLQQIEAELGRDRLREGRYGARTLDIDVVAVGDLVSDDPHLTLPHPRMAGRRFVLEPLRQVAPDFVHPRTGQTLRQLLAALPLLVLLAACHPREPAPEVLPPGQPPEQAALVELPLDATPDLDELVSLWPNIGADDEGLAVLAEFAPKFSAQDLAQSPGARRWVAWTVARLISAGKLAETFPAIQERVNALQSAAPQAPETRFCRAVLRLLLLRGDNGLQANDVGRGVVEDLAADLRALQGWNGPAGFSAPRLRDELGRVEALLRDWPAAAPAAVTPT